jgi:hypothetical protein
MRVRPKTRWIKAASCRKQGVLFEKRTKNFFFSWRLLQSEDLMNESFLLLFFKKEVLTFFVHTSREFLGRAVRGAS